MKKYILLMLISLGLATEQLKAQLGSSPFIGQMLYVSFNFVPRGWAECNGQLLPINQNQALFSLLGTTYGGNGTTTFALPNVQSRVMVGDDNTFFTLGQIGGEENHTLTNNEMPTHTHALNAVSSVGNKNSPEGNSFADTQVLDKEYSNATATTTMNSAVMSSVGGGQSHPNIQPYVTFKCIIALQGIFPSRN